MIIRSQLSCHVLVCAEIENHSTDDNRVSLHHTSGVVRRDAPPPPPDNSGVVRRDAPPDNSGVVRRDAPPPPRQQWCCQEGRPPPRILQLVNVNFNMLTQKGNHFVRYSLILNERNINLKSMCLIYSHLVISLQQVLYCIRL